MKPRHWCVLPEVSNLSLCSYLNHSDFVLISGSLPLLFISPWIFILLIFLSEFVEFLKKKILLEFSLGLN